MLEIVKASTAGDIGREAAYEMIVCGGIESSTAIRMLGLAVEAECLPILTVGGLTFYRAQSTPRWVLYKRAIEGWGETKPLHPAQR